MTHQICIYQFLVVDKAQCQYGQVALVWRGSVGGINCIPEQGPKCFGAQLRCNYVVGGPHEGCGLYEFKVRCKPDGDCGNDSISMDWNDSQLDNGVTACTCDPFHLVYGFQQITSASTDCCLAENCMVTADIVN
jgi:hypothetical protein